MTQENNTADPVIIGIYLTELDHIMVKTKLPDGSFINHPIGVLKDILPPDLSSLERNLESTDFSSQLR